jgi:hypothetical protein
MPENIKDNLNIPGFFPFVGIEILLFSARWKWPLLFMVRGCLTSTLDDPVRPGDKVKLFGLVRGG